MYNFFNFYVEFRVSFINYFDKKTTIRVKVGCSGVYMFKYMRRVILFNIFFNPSFKMTTSFANIARATAIAGKFIY